MKKIFFLLLLLSGVSFGQEEILNYAEEEPEFPGGINAMNKFIYDNVEYPMKSRENKEQGIVYVQFVIMKDGSIDSVKVIRGVSELLDSEAIRVIKKMPKWKPAEQAGKKVNCLFTIPINFRLR